MKNYSIGKIFPTQCPGVTECADGTWTDRPADAPRLCMRHGGPRFPIPKPEKAKAPRPPRPKAAAPVVVPSAPVAPPAPIAPTIAPALQEWVVWGMPPGAKYEDLLLTKLTSRAEAERAAAVLREKHGVINTRVSLVDISQPYNAPETFLKAAAPMTPPAPQEWDVYGVLSSGGDAVLLRSGLRTRAEAETEAAELAKKGAILEARIVPRAARQTEILTPPPPPPIVANVPKLSVETFKKQVWGANWVKFGILQKEAEPVYIAAAILLDKKYIVVNPNGLRAFSRPKLAYESGSKYYYAVFGAASEAVKYINKIATDNPTPAPIGVTWEQGPATALETLPPAPMAPPTPPAPTMTAAQLSEANRLWLESLVKIKLDEQEKATPEQLKRPASGTDPKLSEIRSEDIEKIEGQYHATQTIKKLIRESFDSGLLKNYTVTSSKRIRLEFQQPKNGVVEVLVSKMETDANNFVNPKKRRYQKVFVYLKKRF